MEINYIHENPKAVLHQEHEATIRLQLEETLGTFNGFFFVTLFLNAAVQRLSFGYVTRSTSFNDVRFRLHMAEPPVRVLFRGFEFASLQRMRMGVTSKQKMLFWGGS